MFDDDLPFHHSQDDELPEEAVKLGFTKVGHGPSRSQPFTLKSGPQRRESAQNELEAWSLFFNQKMVDVILENALNSEESLKNVLPPSRENLMKYILFILASGIVKYPQESMVFQRDHSGGLTENQFLEEIFTHKQLQAAKKMFFGSRGDLTSVFNANSQDLYHPTQ